MYQWTDIVVQIFFCHIFFIPSVEGTEWHDGMPSMVLTCNVQVYRLFQTLATLFVCEHFLFFMV